VILVDVNLLVLATMQGAKRHQAARRWLTSRLEGTSRVGLPWAVLLGFTRVVANPRAFARPVAPAAAWQQVRAWLALPSVWVPAPTERHAELVAELLAGESQPKLVPDAHLAALAIEHGLILCSNDRDFSRFEGLRWQDPLRG